MNLFDEMRALVIAALADMAAQGLLSERMDLSEVMVEPPRDPLHGELATNAAMVLAGRARRRPREIAADLAERMLRDPRVRGAEVAGPGFVNLRLDTAFWQAVPAAVLRMGAGYGRMSAPHAAETMLDWHIAARGGAVSLSEARAAVTADMIGALLEKAGHRVARCCVLEPGRGTEPETLVDLAAQSMAELKVPFDAMTAGIADEGVDLAVRRLLAQSVVSIEDDGSWTFCPVKRSGWALRRADRGWTRLARDIAALAERMAEQASGPSAYGSGVLVWVLPADRGGDAPALVHAARVLSGGRVALTVTLVPVVRAATGVREMLAETGADLLRFHLIARRPDLALELDVARMRDPGRDNPAFVVQHAHARLAGVMARGAAFGIDLSDRALAEADLSALTDPAELALMRLLADWPRQVAIAARVMEPHRIATFLVTLAEAVQALTARGQTVPAVRFIQDTPEDSLPKIALARATMVVISAGLGILRVTPMNEMR